MHYVGHYVEGLVSVCHPLTHTIHLALTILENFSNRGINSYDNQHFEKWKGRKIYIIKGGEGMKIDLSQPIIPIKAEVKQVKLWHFRLPLIPFRPGVAGAVLHAADNTILNTYSET